jgi:hypothetical protein
MDEYLLLTYAITFAQLVNGNLEWDWDKMQFLERR